MFTHGSGFVNPHTFVGIRVSSEKKKSFCGKKMFATISLHFRNLVFFAKFRFNLFRDKMRNLCKIENAQINAKISWKKCEHSSKKTKFWINTKYNIDLRTTRRQYIRQFIDFLENNFSAVKIFLLKTQNKIYGKNQNNSET